MKKRTTTLPFLFSLLLACAANAQNDFPCGTDFLHRQALQDPVIFKKHEALEQEAYNFFLGRQSQTAGRGSQVHTIPVVVHIIHDNGPENISDAAVQQAISWLNQAYANQGYYDQGSGADAGIRFCLARRTPDGQPTNGITRDENALTVFTAETQQGAMKNINRWKPEEYINIWVVRDICSTTYGCGLVAYAYHPSYHGSNLDGIVIEATYLNSASNVSVLAHEMGHYFGLYHTFEGGCSNNDCLLDGDKVCDTPPDQSTAAVPCDQPVNTCSTDAQSGFATDQPDMTWNHMDYGHLDCKHDFTPGQADRMNFFLTGTRKSLLESKGCLPPCPLPTVAAFSPGDTTINAGQTIFFDNNSQNAVNFSWTLNGVPFGSQQNAAYLFDSAGVFTVQLVAQPLDGQLCEADSAQVTVQVLCPVVAGFTLSDLTPEEGQTIFITNNSQNAGQFEWFVNGVSHGAVLDSFLFTDPGDFEIRLVAADDFCSKSTNILITVPPKDTCYGYNYIKTYDLQSPWTFWAGIRSSPDGNFFITSLLHEFNYVIKLNTLGTVIWAKRLIADTEEIIDFVATEDNGVIVLTNAWSLTSPTESSIIKLNASGDLEWRKTLPQTASNEWSLHCISRTTDGGYIIGGYMKPPGTAGNLQAGAYFLKIDGSGNQQWAKIYSTATIVTKIVQLANGDFLSVGKNGNGNVCLLDNAGNLIWCKTIYTGAPYSEILPTADGHYLLVSGSGPGSSCPQNKPVLIKITPEGDVVWAKQYETSAATLCIRSVARGNFGGYFAVGTLSGWAVPDQTFFANLDEEGEVLKASGFDVDSADIQFNGVVRVPGGYAISGTTINDFRLVLTKTDEAGHTGECSAIPINLSNNSTGIPVSPYVPTLSQTPVLLTGQAIAEPLILYDSLRCSFVCDTPAIMLEICNNNLDDDGDGLFDCLDTDCNCPEDVCKPGQANIWYFGLKTGLDFSTEPPTVLTDGQSVNWDFSTATVCDASGNLLFYTDYTRVYNRLHQPMYNGEMFAGPSLIGGEQMSIPHPGVPGNFYLFTTKVDGLRYSRVKMQLDYGLGGVAPGEKEIVLIPDSISLSMRMTAIKSCSFDGYWLICIEIGNVSKFIAYKIDQNGLNPNPVVSPAASSISQVKQMKISPDGRRIAVSGHVSVFQIYDFDALSGSVTFPPVYLLVPSAYTPAGFEFSPNGQYLYVSAYKTYPSFQSQLYQYDLKAGDEDEINNSRIILATQEAISSAGPFLGAMQLAPNGKIYIANENNWPNTSIPALHVIHHPDLPAPNCLFQKNGLSLTGTQGTDGGLVNVVQSLFAQPAVTICPNAPDTICVLDSLYSYIADKSGCFSTDSVTWKMEGLAGTLSHDFINSWVKFDAPGKGNLVVTAYTECGIVADTLHIVVTEPFSNTLDLGPDRTVCDNGVFTFNAGSGFSRYRWQDGAPDSVLTTLLPGQYWVDVWDACGNHQSDTVTVSIAPATVLDLGDDRQGCDDLTASFQRPDFFSRWLWSPGHYISCDTCAKITAAPASTNSWVVVAQTDNGCISVDTLTFQISDTLFFQLDTSVCFGQIIDLFGVSLPADTTAQFFFPADGLGCDTLLMVNVLGLDAPMSELDVTVCVGQSYNFNGSLLPADTTATFLLPGVGGACDSVVIVNVTAWPASSVTLPPDTTLQVGATMILKAETAGTGAFSFTWSPIDGLSCTNCPDPEAAPLETTLYTLTVADANGCPAQDSMLVTVDTACVVIIPNAFTPNGDGVNDLFYPKTDPCVRLIRTWRVVSRWGEIIYEGINFPPNDPDFSWDGNRSNGESFPSDVLVWYLELEYFDGRREVRKGDVALLR